MQSHTSRCAIADATGRSVVGKVCSVLVGASPPLKRLALTLVICLQALSPDALARIPEPGNILYGLAGTGGRTLGAGDTGVVILARYGSEDIASYRMGENQQAGDYFVLRVPVDILQPRAPNTAQVGDLISIVMIENQAETTLGSYTVSGRGAVVLINFGIDGDNDHDGIPDAIDPDDDNDGMPDTFEDQYGFDRLNAADASEDADGDGFTNLQEYRAGSNPNDSSSVPARITLPWLQLLLGDG